MTKFASFHAYKIKFKFSGVNEMIEATCLQKIRDNNGNIKAYVLQDNNGGSINIR